MADDALRQQILERLKEDFVPPHDRMNYPSTEARIASAAEYIAHHIGKISRNLERIANKMEKDEG